MSRYRNPWGIVIVFESAVLPSLSGSSPPVRSTLSLSSVRTSFSWQPVSSRRIARMAEGNTGTSASASLSTPRSCGIPRARGTARGASPCNYGPTGAGCTAVASGAPSRCSRTRATETVIRVVVVFVGRAV